MRNPESLFNAVVEFINTMPVGSVYRSKDLCFHTRGIEKISFWKKVNNNTSYRTRTYQGYLKRAGFLKNVSYGVWEIVKHVPDWFDLGHLQHVLGYSYGNKVYKGLTQAQIREKLMSNNPTVNYRAPQAGEAITSFDHIDPLKACIDLRTMGILAVPVDEGRIEIHAIYKDSGEDMAHWMYNNGYDIDDYPELEHLVKTYWPEMEKVEEDCDCDKVDVIVFDYFNSEVIIHQGIVQKDVEDFIAEEYEEDQDVEWMAVSKLKLTIK